MAAKEVRFSDDARTRLVRGVNLLANAVKATLGHPVVAIALVALIVSTTVHMRIGMQVIVEDYVRRKFAPGAPLAAMAAAADPVAS